MRDNNKDKKLEDKHLLGIREKIFSFLLVDVISDKGDFHYCCWTDFFLDFLIRVIIIQFVVERYNI